MKEFFNSFARTLGRIVCYLLIGFGIAILFGKINVNAEETISQGYNAMPTLTHLPTGVTESVNTSSSTIGSSPFYYYNDYQHSNAFVISKNGNPLSPSFSINHTFYLPYDGTSDYNKYSWANGNKSGFKLTVCTNNINIIAGTIGENQDYILYKHDTGLTCSNSRGYSGEKWDIYLVTTLDTLVEGSHDYDASYYGDICDVPEHAVQMTGTYNFQLMLANGTDNTLFLFPLSMQYYSQQQFYSTADESRVADGLSSYLDDPRYNGSSSGNSVIDYIKTLPSAIATSFTNALSSLFVPTEEQVQSIVNQSQNISYQFGFIGQSYNFIIGVFTSIVNNGLSDNGCATMPKFQLGRTSLFESYTIWEEQQVCIKDNALINNNINTIRFVTSIAIITMFISWASNNVVKVLSKDSDFSSRKEDSK